MIGASAVFALCARSTESHLPGVLENLERLSGLYDRSAYVLVEGDSVDDTKAMLKAWAARRPDAMVIEMDGLAERLPRRAERLAACRNAYIDRIKGSPFEAYDQLVLLDADDVNNGPIDLDGFARARDWLTETEAAAAFANGRPFYYDIWALRHPSWCPGDYMDEARQARPAVNKGVAEERFCFSRQIPIAATSAPIDVESAFGGLAIYRMADALSARYVGLREDGEEICEHVPFNRDVARSGRRLCILPWLTIGIRHVGGGIPADSREVQLNPAGQGCTLVTPPDYPLASLRQDAPFFGRRYPVLARLIGKARPWSVAIESDAGVGEGVALCVLEPAVLRFIALEPDLMRLKYLNANRRGLHKRSKQIDQIWATLGDGGEPAFPGPARLRLEDILAERSIPPEEFGLLRLNSEQGDQAVLLSEMEFLKRSAPVVWTRAGSRAPVEDAEWDRFLVEGAETWPFMIAFDDTGVALCAGQTTKKRRTCIDLLAHVRRRRALPAAYGPPPTGFLELALFPHRFLPAYDAFLSRLPELADANQA